MRFYTKIGVIVSLLLLWAIGYVYTSRGTPAEAQPADRPEATTGQPAASPPKVVLDCAGCHGAGKTLPNMGGQQFHKEIHQSITASIHAKLKPDGKPAASCLDCHTRNGDMTTILPFTDPGSTANRANLSQTCGACHEQAANSFHDSIHGKLVDKGRDRAASCADCHGSHNILPPADAASTLSKTNTQTTCAKCHTDIVPDYAVSSHGTAIREGNFKAPNCTDCHSAVSHLTAPLTTRDFNLQMVNKCSSCHEKQAPSYRDTFHGQATALGFRPAATCADCHTPHKNLPASNPLSSVHKDNRVQTCARCHTDANPGFVTYDPHPEPDNPDRSMLVYVIHTFMKWLLIGVFSFFGLHTVLWLQRSIVAFVKEKRHKSADDEQYVVRFAKAHRFTHLLIVISFLGLAATGLPLMYYYTTWGQTLIAMHGGLGVTRFLHRVCAVITLFYALFHVYYIVKKAIFERNFSILYGPESMNIRWQDFIDVFNMFRWFLYLGPRPKLDRWTYWEKFDYFAVFWGIPVIGISGLMLWFPNFFTKFLPGEVLNVAMIVHSEEALLATAFIFAFHFFHNHLRPENFPMDIVIFTGKMTLARFKEERPVEYERLVEEGKLDSVLVDPPSKRLRTISRIFGFFAYITGTILVIAIIITLITSQ
jgi:cytochrome b subunit of formate dehydrogenase/nitrate/TMAO reductase-like tetraheme cytochrome c subunit